MNDRADKQQEFLWNVHTYTNEYIRFADAKAAVVIAWTGAMLGALVTNDGHKHFLAVKVWWLSGLSLAAFVLLTIAFVIAIAVVIPRLWGSAPKGFIFWDDVKAHTTAEEFGNAVNELTDDAMVRHLSTHLFTLAAVASGKFKSVTWSIGAAFSGSIVAAILFLIAP